MVNVSEPLINVVNPNKPKVLIGLAKRQRCWTQNLAYLCANEDTPANRRNLNRSLRFFEQNLVSPYPPRKGKQPAREADGDADRGNPKKRRPPCNGVDSSRMLQRESVLTSGRFLITITNVE